MMRLALTITLSVIFRPGIAQTKLIFQEEKHDFGTIDETAGYADHTFYFVNKGDSPVAITHVKASCGCTTPGWTKEEVMPGDSGHVTARYNPTNRPGTFKKSLKITTTQPSENRMLYISGFVKPRLRSIAKEMPVHIGDLRLRYRSLNMGKITTEKKVEKAFDVYNAGKDSVRLRHALMQVPGHIKLKMKPELLPPGQKGQFLITFDPIAKNDLGFISDNIVIQTDSSATAKNELRLLSTIEEYFPERSAKALRRAPKLLISNRTYGFGKVKAGTLVNAQFELTNGGKEKLKFRKIKSTCSCVTYDIKSKHIKAGKTLTLNVNFDTTDSRGNEYKAVTIFSNDPSAPTQVVVMKGIVQQAQQ